MMNQKAPEPFDLNKFLQGLSTKLQNMKRAEARLMGELIQNQSEQIGRNYDAITQELTPIISEVGRLQRECEELKKQVPKLKDLPKPDLPPKNNKK